MHTYLHTYNTVHLLSGAAVPRRLAKPSVDRMVLAVAFVEIYMQRNMNEWLHEGERGTNENHARHASAVLRCEYLKYLNSITLCQQYLAVVVVVIHCVVDVCVVALLFQQFTLEIMCEYLINIIFSETTPQMFIQKIFKYLFYARNNYSSDAASTASTFL